MLYFTFLVKVSSLHLSITTVWVATNNYFCYNFAKSKLITRSVPVFKLPEKKCIIPSSRDINLTKKSSIDRKYGHKSICINNTQLTIFCCYSATSSIKKLSN